MWWLNIFFIVDLSWNDPKLLKKRSLNVQVFHTLAKLTTNMEPWCHPQRMNSRRVDFAMGLGSQISQTVSFYALLEEVCRPLPQGGTGLVSFLERVCFSGHSCSLLAPKLRGRKVSWWISLFVIYFFSYFCFVTLFATVSSFLIPTGKDLNC